MVNFIIIVDQDNTRRRAYINKIKHLLSPVKGLTFSSIEAEDFSAAWAGGTWTPISTTSDNKGTAIIFGDAIKGPGPERLTAGSLRDTYSRKSLPEPLDGLHAFVSYQNGRLTIGADLFGLFPVYYYASGEIILVASSPELFRHHSLFQAKLNPKGLVGIFLTKGIFDGETLFHGVKRLAPGHLLKCHFGKPPQEVRQFLLPVSTKYFNLQISEQIDLLDQALSESVTRHVPQGKGHCLTLSGGLDSRLLAGHLARQHKKVVTITDGLPSDNEARFAKQVAGSLGLQQILFTVDSQCYAQYADQAVKWQHLSDGFTGLNFWGWHQHLRKIAPRVITGFMADGMLGELLRWGGPKSHEQITFKTFFRGINAEAFRPAILRRLLRQNLFDDLVTETLRRIENTHQSYPGLEFQKTWCFGINHRLRFHDGCGIWMLTFGAWPILPYADRKVIETIGGMPPKALVGRRLEREMLRKKFPVLARIPVGGTTIDTTPLLPTSRQKAVQQLYHDAGIWKRTGMGSLRNKLLIQLRGERRYWSRVSYFNSPGWKAIRKIAEPYNQLLSQLLNEDITRSVVPSANAGYLQVKRTMNRYGLRDTSSLKILTGLAIWLHKNQDAVDSLLKQAATPETAYR